MRSLFISFIFILTASNAKASMFGEENIALLKLVAGQLEEIQQLTEAAGAAKNQVEILRQLNDGINRVTATIQTIEEITKRAKGLDPTSVKRLSDITQLVNEVQELKRQTEEILIVKTQIADEAIMSAGVQSETAYLMGQEMIGTGGTLTEEAATASPGRAAQITASSSANSMLAQGVELQTLSHIAQMQAVQLDLQKSMIVRDAQLETDRQNIYSQSVGTQAGSTGIKSKKARL